MTKHIHELYADWFLHVFHYYNISSADGLSVEEDLRDSQMWFPYSRTLPVLLRYTMVKWEAHGELVGTVPRVGVSEMLHDRAF